MSMVKVAGIEKESMVDGPGITAVIFVQGCPHACEGCHNRGTWDFNGGYYLSSEEIIKEIQGNPILDGVVFSGGEPFCQHESLIPIAEWAKEKNLYTLMYTGYLWEDIKDKPILEYIDFIVDGPFVLSLKDISLKFKGSSNQRTIDVQKSLLANRVVLYDF